jgi:3-oxoacyl-(acyl-carrier-protein) synthase
LSKVVVTGIGVISAIGNDVKETHQALVNGTCGLSSLRNFNTRYADVFKYGEIKTSNQELKELLHITQKGVTRTSLLAYWAAQQAIANSRLNAEHIQSSDTALVIGNTVGGMCLTDELYNDANAIDTGSEYLNAYDCGSITLFLQHQFKINGLSNTINTACSSSLNAIMYGCRLIKNGLAKRAIVGGVDSIAKFTINGFNALGILSDEMCKPFDENRKGLNLGEGAGFLVLEREADVFEKTIYAIVSGYGNAGDAFHPSSLSETGVGPTLAMQQALNESQLSSKDIDYLSIHGTATPNNDEVESRAMLNVFGENMPTFVSSKSKIGHTLGAAGAIESIFSLLAIQHQEAYPSLNFDTPISNTGLIPNLIHQPKKINHVMNNAFGFGGNCSSIIYSRF